MEQQAAFKEALGELLLLAKGSGLKVTEQEIRECFSGWELSEDQWNLIYSYLELNQISVDGHDSDKESISYLKGGKEEREKEAPAKKLTGEDSRCYQMYLEELAAIEEIREQELDMLLGALASGDRAARNRLAEGHLARVVELAREYAGYGVLMLDLIQEGNLGLWQGIQVYHTGDYPALRDRRIRCAMAKAVTLQARSGGVGEKLRKAMQDYCEMDKQLLNELGRNPTVAEIAGRLNMTLEEGESVSSMLADAVMMQKQEKPREEPEESSESVEDTAYFRMRERVAELLSQLDSQDAELLTLRFGLEKGEPLTPEATAARLGLSTREVLDREAKALGLLRNAEK